MLSAGSTGSARYGPRLRRMIGSSSRKPVGAGCIGQVTGKLAGSQGEARIPVVRDQVSGLSSGSRPVLGLLVKCGSGSAGAAESGIIDSACTISRNVLRLTHQSVNRNTGSTMQPALRFRHTLLCLAVPLLHSCGGHGGSATVGGDGNATGGRGGDVVVNINVAAYQGSGRQACMVGYGQGCWMAYPGYHGGPCYCVDRYGRPWRGTIYTL